jgi:mono/diheme cytochrome c family protein
MSRAVSSLIRTLPVLMAFLTGRAVAEDKVTYQDNVLPIFENNCAKCHNPDKLKGDLDLTSFSALLRGGSSGPAVVSGDPDASRLHRSVNHLEDPEMPPKSSKLPEKDLAAIKAWIKGGLLETSGSKAVAVKRPSVDLSVSGASAAKPDGPPPMPKVFLLDPVVTARRASAPTGMAASPWAPLVAITGQKQVLLYNTDSLELLTILPFIEGFPADVRFSRNGKLLIAGGGHPGKSGRVIVWNVESGERLITLGDEYDTILSADISPDQKLIAAGGPSRLVKVYSTSTGELLHKIKKHTDWVTSLAFSPDGERLATGDRNGGISVWDPDNAQEILTLTGHKGSVVGLDWRGDSKLLASAGEDGALKLWEMTDGKQAKAWTAHNNGAVSLQWAAEGRLLTCGRDNQVALWLPGGNKVRSVAMTNDIPVRSVFSQDGQRFIAADWQGNISVFSSTNGNRIGELDLNPPPLSEQIAAAGKRVTELKAKGGDELAKAEATLTRLMAAKLFTKVSRAREELSTFKQEQEKLASKDKKAAEKLGREITAKQKELEKLEAILPNNL